MYSRIKDEVGNIYGRATVIKQYGIGKDGYAAWECQCTCGKIFVTSARCLRQASTNSCGCLRKEKHTTHGLSRHYLYSVYNDARTRCNNKKCKYYKDYGGRGIEFRLGEICDFISNMEPTWFEGATIERIDNNGHYEYNNIRWATQKEQHKNKRNSVHLTYKGETMTQTDWARRLGMRQNTFQLRVKTWGVLKAIETPVAHKKKYKKKELNG